MAPRHELLERVCDELRASGITAWTVDRTGRHIKLRFQHHGQQRLVVMASTPTDYRGSRNLLALVRRILRQSQQPASE